MRVRTLNIFVSGTIEDQRAERAAVEDAVRSLRLDATRAETQYSSERCPRDECLKMVRECDVYLGVYTQTRYGWIIPGDNISVTELEFNEALRLNKPILIFVQKLPEGWTPQNDDEKQQRKRQRAFLKRVLDFDGGKFRAPEFESLAQLQDQVAGSLMQLLVERFKMTVTRPPFYNVPRRLDVFVGRDAYIETLTRALAGGETPPLLVHGFYGVGGLGKTALALELAYRLRHHFDGGVLWADLPTTQPDQTLAAWAREYGADLSRIEDTNARADALRGILSGKRVLAILDGAVDEADDAKIAPLLRALAECAVIVTSRITQLDSLAHAHRVDLDRMSEDEAVALFERIVGNALPRDKIIAIARVVDFLPLALDLAAAQWREHRQSWTADDVLAMLRDERARLDTLQWGDGRTRGIRASIQVSYNRLSEDEQRFFAALGVFAGDDFDVRAVAFVVAEDAKRRESDAKVRERLERFLRLSLVQEGRRAMRYRLHPLLRDYARELQIANYELRIANYELRMARYYCDIARENGPKLEGAEIVRALEILDLEWGNIDAGQAWASGRGGDRETRRERDRETRRVGDKERWELCRDYIYGAMTYYFNLRAMWDEWIAWSEAGIAACQQLGDARGEGAILGNLGLVYWRKGEWDKAIEFYQNALATLEQLGDRHGMAQTYVGLGSVYYRKGAWDKAIEFYQNALRTMEQLGDVHGMAQTFGNLGTVYAQKGEWDKAIEFYQNALATFKQLGDRHGMAQTFGNLGLVYADKGAWDKAIEFYQNALATLEQLGDRHGMAQTFGNLGSVYLQKGAWDKAIEFYQKDLAISEQLGDRHGMAQTFGNLGSVYLQKGAWDKAIEFYQNALATLEQLGDRHGMAQTFGNLGTVYARKGEWDKAIEFYQKDLAISEQLGDVVGLASTWWNLALVYEKQGKIAQAIELMEKAVAIEKKIGHPDAAKDAEYIARLRGAQRTRAD
jgi:tetratricopeptide (TPR) repeat protein